MASHLRAFDSGLLSYFCFRSARRAMMSAMHAFSRNHVSLDSSFVSSVEKIALASLYACRIISSEDLNTSIRNITAQERHLRANLAPVELVYQASTAEIGAKASCFCGKDEIGFESLWEAINAGWIGSQTSILVELSTCTRAVDVSMVTNETSPGLKSLTGLNCAYSTRNSDHWWVREAAVVAFWTLTPRNESHGILYPMKIRQPQCFA